MLDLEPIKARLAAATAGPWECDPAVTTPGPQGDEPLILSYAEPDAVLVGQAVEMADAKMMASSRTDLAELVAEVETLRAAVEATTDALKNIRDSALMRDHFEEGDLAAQALDDLVLAGVWPMPVTP